MKKFLSLVLAAMMLLAMASVAMADNITINNEIEGYEYAVYQVFAGKLSNNKLVDITWGSGVNEEALIPALKNAGIIDAYEADAVPTASEVAAQFTSDEAKDIATIVGANLSTADDAIAATITTSANDQYVATGLATGYYFVKSTKVPAGGTDSAYVLLVSGSVAVETKNGAVEHKKKLKDTNDTTGETTGWQDSADYDIDDMVPFQLTGTVPADYAAFASYKYAFHDIMSAGLTFQPSTVVVKVDGTPITSGYEVVTTGITDGCTFEVKFENLKNISNVKAGSVITVEFDAQLNENAVLGSAGNPNESYLEYSNDSKNPSETGETPHDKVIVFTYKLVINKVDQDNKPLGGATFELKKKLADGTTKVIDVVTTNEGKTFNFTGLDDGDYVLSEKVTPQGYNGIADIEFTISASHDTESADPKLTELHVTSPLTAEITSGSVDANNAVYSGIINGTVVNKSGATLPETGGIGTTLFYLFGGLMTAGSALVLVVRRRADADEE